jgi:hypothetical protein
MIQHQKQCISRIQQRLAAAGIVLDPGVNRVFTVGHKDRAVGIILNVSFRVPAVILFSLGTVGLQNDCVEIYRSAGCTVSFGVADLAMLVELPELGHPAGLAVGCENDPESRPTAHHALVGFVYLFQREYFIHRAHSAEDAKRQRIL